MKVTKKTENRIKIGVQKFQKVLAIAKDRDLNESDTVSIITDMLSEVFGYDKYIEVTSELAIRGAYCDLAIKLGDKFQYLIECKAIGTELKEIHLRQAVGYGANKGIQWLILTNGVDWHIYRLRFEQPISWDLVARFDMMTISTKNERDMERLVIVAKEGVEKGTRESLYEKIQCVNRFVVGALILSMPVVAMLKRELRKISDGISVEDSEIASLLREGVLRRDLLEGEDASAAMAKIARHFRHQAKKPPVRNQTSPTVNQSQPSSPTQPLSCQILAGDEIQGTTIK